MPETLNGYVLKTQFTAVGSGSARWCFAIKDGVEYFLKEFLSPIYPSDDMRLPENVKQARINFCTDFVNQKTRLYHELAAADNGNIIIVKDFFAIKVNTILLRIKCPKRLLLWRTRRCSNLDPD